MKYYVILIATVGTEIKKAIYEATDENNAVALFHQYMSSYMNNDKCKEALVMAINSVGGIYKKEYFTREV